MQKTTLAVWKALVAEAVRTEFPEFSVYPKKQRGDEAGLLKFASSRDGILWAIVFRPSVDTQNRPVVDTSKPAS